MIIAVAIGKGGKGTTFVFANLALSIGKKKRSIPGLRC